MAFATATAATAAAAFTLTISMVVTVVVAMIVTVASTTTATALVVIVIMVVTMTATAAAVIVVMTVIVTATTGTVNVAVGQLFGSGSTHVLDLDLEAQGHASQRMVAIHFDELFGHFNHGHRTVAIVGLSHKSIPFGDFHTVEQLARYFLYQRLVIFAVGLARCQCHFEGFTYRATFQLGFQARDQVTGAVQIDQRLFADSAVDDFTVLVGDCVFQRNHAQRSYFHVRILRIEKNGLRIP